MGLWLYGCDACQTSCVYNQNTYVGKLKDIDYAAPELETLLSLDKAGFTERYKATAVYWRGLNVLKRNAGIALKNHKFFIY